jgi:hypothetical protein
MKKLMILAVLSVFSLSAAAASACDGMKGHEKSGDALFRFSTARNAPLWTTWPVLRREFPGAFGEPAEANGLDVIELRGMVLALRDRVGRLERAARAR